MAQLAQLWCSSQLHRTIPWLTCAASGMPVQTTAQGTPLGMLTTSHHQAGGAAQQGQRRGGGGCLGFGLASSQGRQPAHGWQKVLHCLIPQGMQRQGSARDKQPAVRAGQAVPARQAERGPPAAAGRCGQSAAWRGELGCAGSACAACRPQARGLPGSVTAAVACSAARPGGLTDQAVLAQLAGLGVPGLLAGGGAARAPAPQPVQAEQAAVQRAPRADCKAAYQGQPEGGRLEGLRHLPLHLRSRRSAQGRCGAAGLACQTCLTHCAHQPADASRGLPRGVCLHAHHAETARDSCSPAGQPAWQSWLEGRPVQRGLCSSRCSRAAPVASLTGLTIISLELWKGRDGQHRG